MNCTTPQRSLSLLPDPCSVRAARAFFDEAFCDQHGAHVHQAAALLISELVANAVRHGLPPITIGLRCVGTDTLEVRVHDDSPALPVLRRFEDADAEGGRGMALVDLLSDDWGVEEVPDDGKTVWFHLNMTAHS